MVIEASATAVVVPSPETTTESAAFAGSYPDHSNTNIDSNNSNNNNNNAIDNNINDINNSSNNNNEHFLTVDIDIDDALDHFEELSNQVKNSINDNRILNQTTVNIQL